MISEKGLQKIFEENCLSRACPLMAEYKELAGRYASSRKIKLNLIRSFDEEVMRLRTVLKNAGVAADDDGSMSPTKWEKVREKIDSLSQCENGEKAEKD